MLTRFKNLNIRFLGEGDEGDGGGEVVDEAPVVTPEAPDNDIWAPIRSELDPISFSRIEAHLKDMDRSATERVTRSNQQLAPYKQFIDSGVSTEDLAAGMQLAKQVNDDPAALYTALGTYLEREGRLPSKTELTEEVKANEGVDPNAPEAAIEDPRLATLSQQNEQIMSFLQAQEQQRLETQADREVSSEIDALKAAHQELSAEDVQEIVSRAAFVAQTSGRIPTLESVHDSWYQGLRSRFLTAPRPGDTAPKLLPTSGGLPSNIPQKKLGELSSSEVQDVIASMIEQNRD